MWVFGEECCSRGNSQCKDSEAGPGLVWWENIDEALVAEAEPAKGRGQGMGAEGTGADRVGPCGP